MKRFLPLLIATAGITAAIGILLLLVRLDALPASVRALDWRKLGGTTPPEPTVEETI